MKELTLREIQALELELLRTVVSLCEKHGLRYYLFGGTLLGAIRHRGFIPWDDDVDIAMPRDDLMRLAQICRAELPAHYAFFSWRDDWRIAHNICKVYDTRTVWVENARPNFNVELGVFVDIFPLDGAPKGRLRKRLHGATIKSLRAMLRATVLDTGDRRKSLPKRVLARLWQAIMSERFVKFIHAKLDRLASKYSFDATDEWASYLDYRGPHDYMPKTWIGGGATVRFEGFDFKTFTAWHSYLELTYGDYMTPPPADARRSTHQYKAWWKEESKVGSD